MDSSDWELNKFLIKKIKSFTYKPALTDLDYGAFLDFPEPTFPPFPDLAINKDS